MSEIVDWLRTPHGEAAISIAGQAAGDPLAAAKLLSRLELPSAYRQAASLQAELRLKLQSRWGRAEPGWLLTRAGIEQATPPAVRNWRAAQMRELGSLRVADLGCGLGFESSSFAAAGLAGIAVDRDLETASVAALNLTGSSFEVRNFDVVENQAALSQVLFETDTIFIDPSRRDINAPKSVTGGAGGRISNPSDWSPSWDWVQALAQSQPRLVAKVAPGFDHSLIPTDAHATWFALSGGLVETSIWFSGMQLAPGKSAVVMDRHGDIATLNSAATASSDVGEVSNYILDPSPAITRAGLVEQLAALTSAHRLDPRIGYLSLATEPTDSPLFTTFEVVKHLPLKPKQLKQELQQIGARDVQVTARGWGGDLDALTKELKTGLAGDKVISLLISRIGNEHIAVLAQRLN